ncbi:hypothetical protein D3C73_1616790 [compost metagenome]
MEGCRPLAAIHLPPQLPEFRAAYPGDPLDQPFHERAARAHFEAYDEGKEPALRDDRRPPLPRRDRAIDGRVQPDDS